MLRKWALEAQLRAFVDNFWLYSCSQEQAAPFFFTPGPAGLLSIFKGQWVTGTTPASPTCLPACPWYLQREYHLLRSPGLGCQVCAVAGGTQTVQ